MLSFYLSYIGPALDILLLAFLMYKSYQILIKTQAAQLGKGALLMLLIYAVAFLLHLTTLLWILNMLATGVVIGAAIIFQPELRRMFLTMGQNDWFRRSRSQHSHIDYVLTAAERLSAERRGMLVIFLRQNNLKEIIENPSATRINAEISSNLLVTIFEFDTPLHDGAVVIDNGRIIAAGCYLRGVTDEMRQQTRREVLTTGEAEIRALAELVEKGMKQDIYCVFGNEEKLKENRRLFSRLIPVME